ncbi:hypothetical protein V8E36_007751 [Tilletia maclaganii]
MISSSILAIATATAALALTPSAVQSAPMAQVRQSSIQCEASPFVYGDISVKSEMTNKLLGYAGFSDLSNPQSDLQIFPNFADVPSTGTSKFEFVFCNSTALPSGPQFPGGGTVLNYGQIRSTAVSEDPADGGQKCITVSEVSNETSAVAFILAPCQTADEISKIAHQWFSVNYYSVVNESSIYLNFEGNRGKMGSSDDYYRTKSVDSGDGGQTLVDVQYFRHHSDNIVHSDDIQLFLETAAN